MAASARSTDPQSVGMLNKLFSVRPAAKICPFACPLWRVYRLPLMIPLEKEKALTGAFWGLVWRFYFQGKKEEAPKGFFSVFYIGLFALPKVKLPRCAGSTSAK